MPTVHINLCKRLITLFVHAVFPLTFRKADHVFDYTVTFCHYRPYYIGLTYILYIVLSFNCSQQNTVTIMIRVIGRGLVVRSAPRPLTTESEYRPGCII